MSSTIAFINERPVRAPLTNWFITGGCGFIGKALAARLAADGHAITVLDDASTGRREDLEEACEVIVADAPTWRPGVTLVLGDIRDAAGVEAAMAGADTVVHLAANAGVAQSIEDPRTDLDVNVVGTLNCLQAAHRHGVRRFIMASSGAAVGEVDPPVHEELACRPTSPYGASKLAGEGYCSAFHKSFGLETVVLRFGNVYGPGSLHKGSVVAKWIKCALGGEPLEIYGDGSQTRDFIFIEDLLDAVEKAAAAPGAAGETFQLAGGDEVAVARLAEVLTQVLADVAGIRAEVRTTAPPYHEPPRVVVDIRKAGRLLGWSPQRDLRQGLEETVRWFLDQRQDLVQRR